MTSPPHTPSLLPRYVMIEGLVIKAMSSTIGGARIVWPHVSLLVIDRTPRVARSFVGLNPPKKVGHHAFSNTQRDTTFGLNCDRSSQVLDYL